MTEADLWPRIESLLGKVERPARYVNREWGALHASDAEYRAALIYPDTYEIGQANQAIAILLRRSQLAARCVRLSGRTSRGST